MKKVLTFTLLCLVVLLAGCGRMKKFKGNEAKKPALDPFYTYAGFRDWYRFPLKYPYQVMMVDTWSHGSLERYDGGDIENPNASSHSVMDGWITHLHLHDDYAFFRNEDGTYGSMQYSTGKVTLYSTEEELSAICLSPGDFKTLEYFYKRFTNGQMVYPPQKGKPGAAEQTVEAASAQLAQ